LFSGTIDGRCGRGFGRTERVLGRQRTGGENDESPEEGLPPERWEEPHAWISCGGRSREKRTHEENACDGDGRDGRGPDADDEDGCGPGRGSRQRAVLSAQELEDAAAELRSESRAGCGEKALRRSRAPARGRHGDESLRERGGTVVEDDRCLVRRELAFGKEPRAQPPGRRMPPEEGGREIRDAPPRRVTSGDVSELVRDERILLG